MTRKLFLAVPLTALTACGPLSDAIHGKDKGEHKVQPRAVQAWQGSQLLAANKAAVVAAAHQQGAPDAQVALLLAIVMQESVDSDASQRDASKDGGEAMNFSAFNVNKAFLKKVGWQEGQGPDLNDQKNVGEAVKWVLTGIRQLGEDGFLNFHRGGESGFHNDQLYGCREYAAQVREVQQYLLEHREAWANGQRIAGDVPHV